MKLKEKNVQLKDGTVISVKSVSPKEVIDVLEFMDTVHSETELLVHTPQEISQIDKKQQKIEISEYENSKKHIMIAAYGDEGILGLCSVKPVSEMYKNSHRAEIEISVVQSACNNGIGTQLLGVAVDFAQKVGYAQIELETVSDNVSALILFRKAGFEALSKMPRAFMLENGAYRDCVRLIKYLLKDEKDEAANEA